MIEPTVLSPQSQIYLGDCLEVMKAIPDASVDMVLADLPYGTTACKWDSVIPLDALWAEYRRVITRSGAIVLHCAQPFTTALIAPSLDIFKYCWVWHKSKAADFVNAKNKPMRDHEDIAVFSFGGTANGSKIQMAYYPQGLVAQTKVVRAGKSKFGNIAGSRPSHVSEYTSEFTNYPKSVLYFPNEGKPVHPTQKPLDLAEYLVKTYTLDGQTVLDNTMGSGTTGVACARTGRAFIGIEREPKYFEIAKSRIESALNA
jgi:site-specific DNA-methyltransferase (adenine-specific)